MAWSLLEAEVVEAFMSELTEIGEKLARELPEEERRRLLKRSEQIRRDLQQHRRP